MKIALSLLLLLIFAFPGPLEAKENSLNAFTNCIREKLMLGLRDVAKLEILCNSRFLDIDVIIKRLQVTDNYYFMELNIMDIKGNERAYYVSEGYGDGNAVQTSTNFELIGPFGSSQPAITQNQQQPQQHQQLPQVQQLQQRHQAINNSSVTTSPRPQQPGQQIIPPQNIPFSNIPGCDGFGPHPPHCHHQ
ncbi:MAG: hypothetical protein IPM57_12485 [Oligoflexia bacterium]|nr:hypothetical protein [Oligoflexia bacterium]